MGLISDKLKESINKNDLLKTKTTIAIITSYDHRTNTASIAFHDPTGGGLVTRQNVKIQLSSGGVSYSAPTIHQKCVISFLNDSILSPIITSFISEKYYNEVYTKKTTTNQGAYLVDSSVLTIDTSIDTTPMIHDWLDLKNTDASKYNAPNLTDYINLDIDKEVFYQLLELDKYKENEDGITNLLTKSSVKINENGDIDLFVADNTGIRICLATKTVSFFAKSIEMNLVTDVVINGNVLINGELTAKGKESEHE